jgi:hypothetical protein
MNSQVLWAVVINEATCWRRRPYCGVMNKHLSNFSALQSVHLSNLIYTIVNVKCDIIIIILLFEMRMY